MRLVIATCSVHYQGRLEAHLPTAPRLLMIKADGSLSIHADDKAYKPLNWMSSPCRIQEEPGVWTCTNSKGETLTIEIDEIHQQLEVDLGTEPGLQKDGAEMHLQKLLAANPGEIQDGLTCSQREFATSIGPVDLLCRDADGRVVLVEIKRRVNIDAVEQLSRYLEVTAGDATLRDAQGILVGQHVAPQARTLAESRGLRCVVVDYDRLRGLASTTLTLFD